MLGKFEVWNSLSTLHFIIQISITSFGGWLILWTSGNYGHQGPCIAAISYIMGEGVWTKFSIPPPHLSGSLVQSVRHQNRAHRALLAESAIFCLQVIQVSQFNYRSGNGHSFPLPLFTLGVGSVCTEKMVDSAKSAQFYALQTRLPGRYQRDLGTFTVT